jgi:beta-1,4-mannosyl-glycoprotein beta-1,4-N-acetylglucosaminyltransferase
MVDTFIFWNELDLLEIRLNMLNPYVDKFVLVEAPITHTGKPKPLYFQDNADRFKDFNITALVAPLEYEQDKTALEGALSMVKKQRDFIANGIVDNDDEEIIMYSDVDEIPNLKGYAGQEGVFRMRLYLYYLNMFSGVSHWKGTLAFKKKNWVSFDAQKQSRALVQFDARRIYRSRAPVIGSGWHWSYLGTVQNMIDKVEAFPDQAWNTDFFKEHIEENVKNFTDPFNRFPGRMQCRIRTKSLPEYILTNRARYEHLFWKEGM